MGKATGFMEFARCNTTSPDPRERIRHFNEFHPPLSEEKRREQGARCMNCGVPFCQSGMVLNGMATGCPLHNLIPEWNDEIYSGNWDHALSRLLKTNDFPEFTGRVCPALCEAACTCGLNGDPVTVRENELALIEYGFSAGLMQPKPPAVRSGRRVAVVGSGPSGLACADRLNHRGHQVTVLEKADRPGGLLMYGIPNMKLDKSVVERRIRLMEAEGVIFRTGVEVGANLPAQQLLEEYDAVVLCAGAGKPRDLSLPGRDAKGVHFAVDFLTEATKAVLAGGESTISARGKRVVVVGGGDTGNDCVGTCLRQGCKSVIQLEMMPKLPDSRAPGNEWPQWPRVCKTDYGQQEAIAVFGSDPRLYQTTVQQFVPDAKGKLKEIVTLKLQPEKAEATGRTRMVPVEGSETTLKTDLVLIAAGFLGPADTIADAFGTARTPRSTVATAAGSYATNVEKVFCAGDMHRGQSLVVHAINEGRCAARAVDRILMGYTNML